MSTGKSIPKGVFYADTDDKIARVLKAIRRADSVGLDTEFSGVEVGKQSCAARARIHIWSIAVPTDRINARGVRVAEPAVFPASALQNPGLRVWLEDPNARKVVHNLPVDAHAFLGRGIWLRGGINTLSLARWAWPDRARGAGFTLDSLGHDFLGVGKLSSYKEIFTETIMEYIIRTKRISYCECGASPCRKRITTPGHRRLERIEETRIEKPVEREIPLESVVPGHAKWPEALEYSAQDAVLALGVFDKAVSDMARTRRVVPW